MGRKEGEREIHGKIGGRKRQESRKGLKEKDRNGEAMGGERK